MAALAPPLLAHAPSGALAPVLGRRLALDAHRGERGTRWTPMAALAPPLLAHAPSGALAPVFGRRLALDAHRGKRGTRWTPMAALAPPLLAHAPSGALASVTRRPEIVPLHYADFRFPDPALDHRRGVVMGYAIRHARGIVLFDTGFGFGNAELDARYRIRARRIQDVIDEAGLRLDDVIAAANCHLHVDHAGQNSALPGIPIHVQPREWEIAHTTEHTILEWIDVPGAHYERIAGDHDIVEGIRVIETPGHTPGHQSLAVETDAGLVVLAGQAVYTVEEWEGRPDELDGRPNAPLADAYDASLDRLRALEPAEVRFGHDLRAWTRSATAG